MITALRRNPVIAGLALLAAALVVILAIEVAVGERGAEVPLKRGAAPDPKLLPPVALVSPEQAYAETTARPLFVPARRPAPAVAVAAAPAFQRGQFTLQGVIVAGNSRTAMLREKTSGRMHRLETGGEVNGVKVVQIDPAAVTLGMGEERELVPLVVQRPGAPGSQAAAAPPPSALVHGPFGAPTPASAFPQAAAAPPGSAPAQAPAQAPASGAQPLTAGGRPAFPTQPRQPATEPGPGPNTPQAGVAPMSPEELLARRRARRAQQNQ